MDKFVCMSESISGCGETSALTGVGSFELQTCGTWTGKLYLEKSEDGGKTWIPVKLISSCNNSNVSLHRYVDEPTMLRVRAFEWSDGCCQVDMSFNAW